MYTSVKSSCILPVSSLIMAFEDISFFFCIFEEDLPKISPPDQKKIKPVSKALLLDPCFIPCLDQVYG